MEHVKGVRSPDLCELCEKLQSFGADQHLIGRLYLSAVSCVYVFSKQSRKNYSVALVEDKNNIAAAKEDSQRIIRRYFSNALLSIKLGEKTLEEILIALKEIKIKMTTGNNLECVENVLFLVLEKGKFGLIGEAVIKGSENYRDDLPRGMRGFEYRLYREYDCIRIELEKIGA